MTEGLIIGDVRDVLPTLEAESVNCIVTSPPYWGLRDYGVDGQIGLEDSPQAWVDEMVSIFRECRRVLRKDGTCWVNVGDCYIHNRLASEMGGDYEGKDGLYQRRADYIGGKTPKRTVEGLKTKDLCLMPFRLALALQVDGWYVRSHIIWAKKSPMPESVTDRPTSAHESIFLLTKSAKYWYDADAVREPYMQSSIDRVTSSPGTGSGLSFGTGGKREAGVNAVALTNEGANLRNIWHLGPEPFSQAHFATFPTEIPKRCILAGCPPDGVVLDPFMGAGTTAKVAQELGRKWIGIELNPEYAEMAEQRAGQYGWAI